MSLIGAVDLRRAATATCSAWCSACCRAVVYSISLILQKPLVARLPALQVTWLACTVGAVACLPFAGRPGRRDRAAPGVVDLGWVVYLGVFPTAIAFTTYAFALRAHERRQPRRDDLPRAADHRSLLGLVFLAEAPPAMAYVGGALALVGVALARRKPRRATAGPATGRPPEAAALGRAGRAGRRPGRRLAGLQPAAERLEVARSTRRAACATPTPCGSRRRSRARGSC